MGEIFLHWLKRWIGSLKEGYLVLQCTYTTGVNPTMMAALRVGGSCKEEGRLHDKSQSVIDCSFQVGWSRGRSNSVEMFSRSTHELDHFVIDRGDQRV